MWFSKLLIKYFAVFIQVGVAIPTYIDILYIKTLLFLSKIQLLIVFINAFEPKH